MVWIYLSGRRTPVYGKVGEGEAEVLQQARDTLAVQHQIGRTFTVGSVEEFIETVWRPSKEIRRTSQIKYRGILNHHILPAIGRLPLTAVRYEHVLAMRNNLTRKDGRKGALSPRHKREVVALTKDIFNLARQVRGIPDPTEALQLPKVAQKKERTEPEADFTIKLLAAARCSKHTAWLEGPLFAAMFLGLRRGEVAGLKKSDIDRKALAIHIRTQRHPAYSSDVSPKGDKARTIEVPLEIIQRLEMYSRHDSVYVFVQKSGKPVYPNEISKKTPGLCEDAGLGRRTFHDLRALAASNLLAAGADPLSIMEILGHTKFDTSLRYLDAKAKAKREGIGALLRTLDKAQNE